MNQSINNTFVIILYDYKHEENITISNNKFNNYGDP